MALQEVQQLDGLGDVIAVVADGVGHRVGYHDQGRAVHYRINIWVIVPDLFEKCTVGEVAFVEGSSCGEFAASCAEIVEDDGFVSLIKESGDNCGSNESCSTSD